MEENLLQMTNVLFWFKRSMYFVSRSFKFLSKQEKDTLSSLRKQALFGDTTGLEIRSGEKEKKEHILGPEMEEAGRSKTRGGHGKVHLLCPVRHSTARRPSFSSFDKKHQLNCLGCSFRCRSLALRNRIGHSYCFDMTLSRYLSVYKIRCHSSA